jgi:hypothetical protein
VDEMREKRVLEKSNDELKYLLWQAELNKELSDFWKIFNKK